MKVVLEITSGSHPPRFFEIEPGPEVVVGSMLPAQIILPDDRAVASRHFALSFDDDACRIRNLDSSHATLLNGRPIMAALANDGDLVIAGKTLIRVHIGDEPPGATRALPAVSAARATLEPALAVQESRVPQPALRERVLEVLRSQSKPLFAVLDAARDPLVIARLLECGEQYQSLYEGPKAAGLADVAPYLVTLPHGSPLLETLVRDGWGKSWGIYLVCDRPSHEVRKHLRRFLTVDTEGGKRLLFRFYDPRVLRVYLPTCTDLELGAFFGPIREFLLEGGRPEVLLRFAADNAASNGEAVPLAPLPEGQP